jgi:hypothetical protein
MRGDDANTAMKNLTADLARAMIDYDGKVFQVRSNSDNGEVDGETRFWYRQEGTTLTGTYAGGGVEHGHLVGRVLDGGRLEFCYHHVGSDGAPRAGRCRSVPRILDDGRILLDESWQWYTGDASTGTSQIIEVRDPKAGAPPAAS